jgi:hypothetical protein
VNESLGWYHVTAEEWVMRKKIYYEQSKKQFNSYAEAWGAWRGYGRVWFQENWEPDWSCTWVLCIYLTYNIHLCIPVLYSY